MLLQRLRHWFGMAPPVTRTDDLADAIEARQALAKRQLFALSEGRCPDCCEWTLIAGPRGGVGRNLACSTCGAEFNHACGLPIGERISAKDHPDVSRLRDIYDIVPSEHRLARFSHGINNSGTRNG